MMGNYRYGSIGGFGWIGIILGLVVMIAVIVGFVFLVVWAVRRMNEKSVHAEFPNSTDLSAKDIAKARYVKGEISREEFQQLLSDISH
ncbi:MAG: SHOCT domain-containing protein [Chloroflexi bacterium]|nr:SHOCT domain-containing protein [Chloroflexota bacterium]